MIIGDEVFMWFLRGMASRDPDVRIDSAGRGFYLKIPVALVVKGLMDKYSVSRATAYRWISFHQSRPGFWVRSIGLRLVQSPRGFILSAFFKGPVIGLILSG